MQIRLKPVLKNLGIILIVIYFFANLFLFFWQEKFIFDPHPLNTTDDLSPSIEMKFKVDDNVYLSAQMIKDPNNADKGVVLYLHGNRGNVRRALYQSKSMLSNGEDSVVLDYRGYGRSSMSNSMSML